MPRKPPPPALPRAPLGSVTAQMQVRLSPELLEQVQEAARLDGLTQSEWSRQALQRAAEKTLERHGRK